MASYGCRWPCCLSIYLYPSLSLSTHMWSHPYDGVEVWLLMVVYGLVVGWKVLLNGPEGEWSTKQNQTFSLLPNQTFYSTNNQSFISFMYLYKAIIMKIF